MKFKKELYLKYFIYAFLFAQICILGGIGFFIFSPFYDGDIMSILFLTTVLDFLTVSLIIFLYIRNPNPDKLITKERFAKIGPKHMYIFTFIIPALILVYGFGYVFRNYIPLPIPGFYGDIVLLSFIIWCIVFRNEFIQIFDVIDVFIKYELYPGAWPAESRRQGRISNLEMQYQHWVRFNGTPEEQNYYQNLLYNSPDEAKKYATSRIGQIKSK